MNIEKYNTKMFEEIKHIDEQGNEYWEARELQIVLEYTQWRRFYDVIHKAIIACINSNNNVNEHFAKVGKTINMPNGASKTVDNYKLSRYACYLIVQNGNSKKEAIALGQTYFAIQTRRMELFETEYESLSEDEKRFYQRNLTKKGNYTLNQTAKKSGVKNLRYREDILDNMCSEELAANLFRITQTESKLKKDHIEGEENANKTHYTIGKNIREVIKKNGGTMPEKLKTPHKSLKQLEKETLKLSSKKL